MAIKQLTHDCSLLSLLLLKCTKPLAKSFNFDWLICLFQVEGGGEDLKIFFLTKNGRVLVFQDNRHQTQANFCLFVATR